ncbi:NADH-quinone oxidoreductase subunit J [Streptomyces sp. NPDC059164]|uniref:NADH-quinone oxidoreductase subunit J family protein n=1 Tax=Streptomyces sp. NPDC059164 TaxID=3346750 RepID=UPI0036ABD2E8
MVHTAPPPLIAAAAGDHPGFLSPSGVEIAFLLVGLVTLGAAVITVTTRQLVHAALWLVVALGGLAVEYLLLTAEFIAWVQVLIYVGSIVVLLLFGLMLTRAPIGRSPDADSGNRWAALGVALASGAALVWVVVDAFRTTWIDLDGPAQGSTDVTGAFLFRNWVLPFEALSVLLLAALVGAIVLSRKRDTDTSTDTSTSTDTDTSTDTETSTDTDTSTDTETSTDTDTSTDTETSTATDSGTTSKTTTGTGTTATTGTSTTGRPGTPGHPGNSGKEEQR